MTHDNWYPGSEEPPDPPDSIRALEGREAEAGVRRFGTSSALLREAALRGFLARRDFSHPHYPPTTAGFMDWSSGNKVLRDLHVPRGWTARDDSCVPKTVAPDGSFAITMIGGNDDTGLPHRIPSTRRPRGTQGEVDVRDNSQGDFWGYVPPVPREKTYYLLVNDVTLSGRTILRLELSRPWELKDGHVIRWYQRIILPEIDIDKGPSGIRSDDDAPTPEIDVRVERRGT